MEEKIKIYCDGGSRGNPGKSASAFVVEINGKIIYKESQYLGIETNNFAEYKAVYLALNWIKENENKLTKEIIFILDSELVARQLNGIYKIKNLKLKKIFLQIKNIKDLLKTKIIFQHVLREKNKDADLLVNETLDNNL